MYGFKIKGQRKCWLAHDINRIKTRTSIYNCYLMVKSTVQKWTDITFPFVSLPGSSDMWWVIAANIPELTLSHLWVFRDQYYYIF